MKLIFYSANSNIKTEVQEKIIVSMTRVGYLGEYEILVDQIYNHSTVVLGIVTICINDVMDAFDMDALLEQLCSDEGGRLGDFLEETYLKYHNEGGYYLTPTELILRIISNHSSKEKIWVPENQQAMRVFTCHDPNQVKGRVICLADAFYTFADYHGIMVRRGAVTKTMMGKQVPVRRTLWAVAEMAHGKEIVMLKNFTHQFINLLGLNDACDVKSAFSSRLTAFEVKLTYPGHIRLG